jgi:hypothetical protein
VPVSRAAPVVAAGAALVLVAGLGVVVLQGVDRSEAYDEQSAVAAFRSEHPEVSSAASPSALPAGPPPAAPSASPEPDEGQSAAPAPTRRSASPPAAGGAVAVPSAPPAREAPGEPARDRDVQPGVYRYATEGHEEVDALGGARHDYPATTTVTYTRKGCGTEERWQPLQGRVGAAVHCTGPSGSLLRSTYQEREFFGQSQAKSYRCDPGVLLRPRDPRPGQTWQGRCDSGDSTIALTGRVVALEEIEVGGTAVPVVRVRLEGILTGSTRGRSDREVWLARADGLMVQAVASTDTDADTPGGTVRYRESYRLRLQSLQPSR